MEVEHLDDLPKRVAQGVVQPRCEHQHPVAERRSRQRRGHRRLDFLPAVRAPIAMDRVLGDFRLRLGNVFRVADARLGAAAQLPAAFGADVGPVRFVNIDSRRLGASTAEMPLLAAGLLLSPRRSSRLGIRRLHARRRGWRIVRRTRLRNTLNGQLLGKLQQRKHNSFFTLRIDVAGLLFCESRSQRNF